MAADISKSSRPPLQHRSTSHGSFTNIGTVQAINHPLPPRPTIIRSSSSAATTILRTSSPSAPVSLVESPRGQDDIDDRPTKRAKIGDETSGSGRRKGTLKLVVGKSIGLPHQPCDHKKRSIPARVRSENAARRANGISPPPIAVNLTAPPQTHVADFFPWNGLQPEDRLDEQVVKSGYADKALSPNQNESNTARQTLSTGLNHKNHALLHNLSLLYTQVLEKRQVSGKFSTQSTFRPPPRVTVTDTKREAWLRDLANPSVPLRRQSRTIPHGVRGKLLLEQCIAKNVPLQRAVWLAKCVGANELRAFRRKGVNGTSSAQGEAKWIRDWTISVEHFFSSITNGVVQTWQQNLEYALKLIHALFSENLLEKDHFLDWLVTSVSASSTDLLPLWLLMVNTYWSDLLAFERRGRRLALAILDHLHRLTDDGPGYEPLTKRLTSLIESIATTSSGCLVSPDTWSKYEDHLRRLPAFQSLCRRNQRLSASDCQTGNENPLSEIYHVLDAIDLSVDVKTLADSCVSLLPEIHELILALITYASTPYRNSDERALLVQCVIAELAFRGMDTDSALLAILSTTPTVMDLSTIFALIADLVVQGFASAGRYMQWLIITGTTTNKRSMYSGLLQALPSDRLPQHLRNTRTSLLERLELSSETELLETAMKSIETAIKNGMMTVELPHLAKGSLDSWIVKYLQQCKDDLNLPLSAFQVLRSVLEQRGRVQTLHILIDAFINTDDYQILGAVADTVHRHSLGFAITHQLSPLVDRIMERYRKLRTLQPLEKSCIHALHDLIEHVSGKKATLRLLANDLTIYEQQNLNAVCSPASDSLVNMRADSMENDEEIDAVFASGNTMDEGLMQRVLIRIMYLVDKRPTNDIKSSRVCGWLTQLQLLDRSAFERTVRSFIANSSPSSNIIPALQAIVASDCLSVKEILAWTNDTMSASTSLNLLTQEPEVTTFNKFEAYHLDTRQRSYMQDHGDEVAVMLQQVLDAGQPSSMKDFTNIVIDLAALPDLATTIVTAAGAVSAQQLFDAVLRRDQSFHSVETMTPIAVVNNANALNAQFCAAWFRAFSLSHKSDADQEMCQDALIEAVRSGGTWSPLLAACEPEIVKNMHAWALRQTLSMEQANAECWRLLDATFAVVKLVDNAAVLAMIATKLTVLEKNFTGDDLVMLSSRKSLRSLLRVVGMCSADVVSEQETQNRSAVVLLLCKILAHKGQQEQDLQDYVRDVAAMQLDLLPVEHIFEIREKLKQGGIRSSLFEKLFGMRQSNDDSLGLAVPIRASKPTTSTTGTRPTLSLGVGMNAASQRSAATEYRYVPYLLKRWDVIQEPTPVVGENDSSINLSLFGARKVY